MATPSILAAAAAAVLSTKYLDGDERDRHEGQRFFVHPHVATVGPDEPALTSYLKDIYNPNTRVAVDVPAPTSPSFKALATKSRVADATAKIAEALRSSMEAKSANPGIVFGFLLQLDGGTKAHGVVKADLEDAERFFMEMTSETAWTIASVRDILPPPQTKFAKYAISPRPKAPGAAGIRDTQADPNSAAEYFLSAIGLVVPRRTGTKAAVAQAAKQAGYSDQHIRRELDAIKEDSPVDDVVSKSFPDIVRRDWDAFPATMAEGFVREDRQSGIRTRYDRDAMVASFANMEIGPQSIEATAVELRGERHVMPRVRMRSGTVPGLEFDDLSIAAIDEHGLLTATTVFDADGLDAASAELDRLAAIQPSVVRAVHRHRDLVVGCDWGAVRDSMAMTYRHRDRRPGFTAEHDAEDRLRSIQALAGEDFGVELDTVEVRGDRHGLFRWCWRSSDGLREIPVLFVATVDADGGLADSATFDDDDLVGGRAELETGWRVDRHR